MKNDRVTGAIIALGFPDSFVKLSNEGVTKITPLLGIGNKHGVKVGHAALCTVDYSTGDVHYYDFGRYITPDGYGRTRSVLTDEELAVPLQAKIINNEIQNLDEILYWLEAHPEKTHGEGVMMASVCSEINIEDANNFITAIHTKGSIPYGVFVKQGSNCARFVFNTIMASCENPRIVKNLNWEKMITPSPLGTLSKASSSGLVYEVRAGNISERKPFSTIGSWKYFFDKPEEEKKEDVTCSIEGAHLLKGVGSSAYFTIKKMRGENEYLINRFTEKEEIDCSNVFIPTTTGFNINRDYEFIYDSNCHHCHIRQEDKTYRFNKKEM